MRARLTNKQTQVPKYRIIVVKISVCMLQLYSRYIKNISTFFLNLFFAQIRFSVSNKIQQTANVLLIVLIYIFVLPCIDFVCGND